MNFRKKKIEGNFQFNSHFPVYLSICQNLTRHHLVCTILSLKEVDIFLFTKQAAVARDAHPSFKGGLMLAYEIVVKERIKLDWQNEGSRIEQVEDKLSGQDVSKTQIESRRSRQIDKHGENIFRADDREHNSNYYFVLSRYTSK